LADKRFSDHALRCRIMSEADQDLAVAWLANERLYSGRAPDDNSVPAGYDFVIDGQVSELVFEDADPQRGAMLVDQMLETARDEEDLGRIGIDPLENLLRYHGELLSSWVENRAETSRRFRFALGSCWPFDSIRPVVDRLDLHKGKTHSYWTIGVRLRCGREPSSRELLEARLQPDVIGGGATVEAGDQIIYLDYWARDRADAETVGNRLEQAVLEQVAQYRCAVVRRVGPERTWPPGTRAGIDRPWRSTP
jgi:hypothetical protein